MAVKVHWFQIEPNLKEYEYQFTGLSTDEKPQDERVAANSLFFELDTGDFYYCESCASSEISSVIPETIFEGEETDYPYYEYYLGNYNVEDYDSIKVVFDGAEYAVGKNNGFYGASQDGEVFDFSNYPFSILCLRSLLPNVWHTTIFVEDELEHTVEVFSETITHAIWKKVGSGKSDDTQLELFFDQTISTWDGQAGNNFYCTDYMSISKSPDKVVVEYDGTKYNCTKELDEEFGSYYYGAEYDAPNDTLDFSKYPFRAWFGDGNETLISLMAPDDQTHTFKIYEV